ncbi:uncharacterized protein METZ01_LOCUS352576, partial [marine metagenome]
MGYEENFKDHGDNYNSLGNSQLSGSSNMMPSLNRRNFLRGLGVSIALPALESLGVAPAKSAAAKCFVCVSPNYGMNPGGFFP